MKTLLSNTIVKWYKRLGFAGAARWRLLYWAYKIWPGLHIRHHEWNWVLNYLPPLNKWQKVNVLDVGATSSLFIYELARRGYNSDGLDVRPYQEKLPKHIRFYNCDIRSFEAISYKYDFITCISVLEHIPPDKQAHAVGSMLSILKPDGRLLLTIPTIQYAQGHPWEGFTYEHLTDMLQMGEDILEYTERAGQICVAITKRF